jgi:hypothetical protein
MVAILSHRFFYLNGSISNCVLLFFLFPVLLGAIAKSARAAGISATQADKYASNLLNRLPGN